MSDKSQCLNLSPNEAISLEIKLNKSNFGKKWRNLGDILYNCRLDPTIYKNIKVDHEISVEQAEWIKHNIIVDQNKKYFKFFY